MRILWVSAGHFFETGYGLISHDAIHYLIEQGYDVIATSNQLDLAWSEGYVTIDGVKTLPKANDPFLRDVTVSYIKRWNPDLVISLWDVWIYYDPIYKVNYIEQWKKQARFKWAPYVPIDADLFDGCPIVEVLKSMDHLIAMSPYGQRELLKFFPASKVSLLPHWIDTNVYYPEDFDEALEEVSKIMDENKPPNLPSFESLFDRDTFTLIFVGENISERKDIPRLLRAFKLFLDMVKQQYPKNVDKVKLILRTNPTPVPGNSFDVSTLINKLNLNDNVVTIGTKIPSQYLNDLYNISTVYVSASRGEGFGIPIVEAMATGRPAILPKHSAHVDHIGEKEERGWFVKAENPAEVLWTLSLQAYPIVNVEDFARRMFEVYEDFLNGGKEIERKGNNALEYARSLDKREVLPKLKEIIEKVVSE